MSFVLHRVSLKLFLHTLDRAERAYLISGVASELAAHRGWVLSSGELLEAVYAARASPPRRRSPSKSRFAGCVKAGSTS